jgi:polyhydroxyalkanoate synthesis regulator phasin
MNIQEILKDGMIDSNEAAKIVDEIMSDGKVSREEATKLFELKDKATSTCPEFDKFFVEAITSHIMEDGIADEEEINWFKSMSAADGEYDDLEKEIAKNCEIEL